MPAPDAPPSVDTVVVMAARLPPSIGDAAFSTVKIDSATLQMNERLDDALKTAPGVSLFRRTSTLGGNPTTQGVSLRGVAGSGASRALVTLDGVPQNDPFGGWVIWTGLPSEAIAGATVVRGAGSGAYGAGALTGVIALEQPDSVPDGAQGDVEAADHGFRRAAVIAELGGGGVRTFLDASGESSDGWTPVRQGRGPVDLPLTLHDWSAAERVEVDLGRAVLAERIASYEEDRGAGTEFAGSRARGAQGSLTLAAQPSQDRWGWRLQGWASGSDLRNTTASVALNRQTATLANDQYATPAYGVGLNAALRRATSAASLEIGADVRDDDGQSQERLYTQGVSTGARVSGGGEVVGGAYVDASRRVGEWLATGGVRVDGWRDYGSSFIQTGRTPLIQSAADQGGVLPTGRLGLRRDLPDDVFLRAAAYAGFRPATLNELHRSFRVGNDATLANSELRPERLAGGELGIGGARGAAWDLDVFYNQLADAITNVTIGRGPKTFPIAGFVAAGGTLYQRENAGRIDAYGLEGEASRRLGATLSLRAAFSYTHARVYGGAEAAQLTGLRPAQTPSTVVTAGAAWRPTDRLNLSAEVRYESSRFDDDLNTRRIAPGTGVDARLELALTRRLTLFVAGDNVFDAGIQTGRTAAGLVSFDAPRIVRVGLALRR